MHLVSGDAVEPVVAVPLHRVLVSAGVYLIRAEQEGQIVWAKWALP